MTKNAGIVEWGDGQPTVYTTLSDKALASELELIANTLSYETNALADRVNGRVREALRLAYVRGIQDGFQQGVAAECNRRDQPTES